MVDVHNEPVGDDVFGDAAIGHRYREDLAELHTGDVDRFGLAAMHLGQPLSRLGHCVLP